MVWGDGWSDAARLVYSPSPAGVGRAGAVVYLVSRQRGKHRPPTAATPAAASPRRRQPLLVRLPRFRQQPWPADDLRHPGRRARRRRRGGVTRVDGGEEGGVFRGIFGLCGDRAIGGRASAGPHRSLGAVLFPACYG